ncbi:E3 ubiquitin-protein ligase UHRF1-like [Halichondria panicea]
MEYPDGYLEAQAAKKQSKEAEADDGAGSEEEADNKGKRGRKRKAPDSKAPGSPAKKSKQPRYELSKGQRSLIKADTVNSKVWEELLASSKDEGSAGLLSRIQETFNCIVCQEVVYQPVTTTCSHNICKTCLSRSFKVDVYSCPNCRHDLGKDYAMTVNKSLQAVLLDLFPGYNGGR